MASLLKAKEKALPPVTVTFLGTCSGGGPIVSRNCSSLAVDFGSDIWLFDCADGTLARLHQSSLKMSNISRIFITHMHADHVLGLVPILTTIMSGVGTTPGELERLAKEGVKKVPTVIIYGPQGLRELVRTTLRITGVTLSGVFAVHELLPNDAGAEPSVSCRAEELHTNEGVGRDLKASEEGVWEGIMRAGEGKGGKSWGVAAGPITHRVPSHGYILTEPPPLAPLDTATLIPLLTRNAPALALLDPPVKHPLSILSRLTSLPPPPPFTLPSGETLHPPGPSGVPPRKIVIFGDCNGGTENPRFREMCADVSLLVHECTNASIPERIQRGEKGRRVRVEGLEHSLVKQKEMAGGCVVGKEPEPEAGLSRIANGHASDEAAAMQQRDEAKRAEVRKKARSRGHCTPAEVGEFARDIRARRVVVNHFSAMFPSPRYPSSDPFPSLLSPISPFPYPTPHPIAHSPDPPVPPLPLTRGELHMRLIMQSLADQIGEAWNGVPPGGIDDGRIVSGEGANGCADGNAAAGSEKTGQCRLAIPARDFMVLRLPSHELSLGETAEQARASKEAEEVMELWSRDGGAWVEEAKGRRWVGVQEPPVVDQASSVRRAR